MRTMPGRFELRYRVLSNRDCDESPEFEKESSRGARVRSFEIGTHILLIHKRY